MKKIAVIVFLSALMTVSYSSALTGDMPGDASSNDTCYTLSSNMYKTVGSGYYNTDAQTNGEVTKLQQFLQDNGYLIPNPTGYFGAQTFAAVKKFQANSNIGPSGYVGPLTRAQIRAYSCTTTSVSTDGVTTTVTATTTPINSLYRLILGRDVDAPSATYYQGRLSFTGITLSDIAWELLTSGEGQKKNGDVTPMFTEQYVELLYSTIFGRPSDLAGKSYYVGILLNGSVTKKAVFDMFFNSPESRTRNTGVFGTTGTSTTTTTSSGTVSLSVSNFSNGTFTTNGTVYSSGYLYSRITGVNSNNPPRGCAQPAGSTKCQSAGEYRPFTSSEWLNSTTIQTVITNPSDFPVGSYDSYIMYADGKPIKAGTFTLKAGVTVSNSANGPFVDNGSGYNNLPFYSRILGVNSNNPPLGCAKAQGSTGCVSSGDFRSFTSSEWLDSSTIQTVIQNPAVYPVKTYENYLLYPNGIPFKIGVFTLNQAQQTQSRQNKFVCFVAGPTSGPDTSAYTCNASNYGETRTIGGASCTCQ